MPILCGSPLLIPAPTEVTCGVAEEQRRGVLSIKEIYVACSQGPSGAGREVMGSQFKSRKVRGRQGGRGFRGSQE